MNLHQKLSQLRNDGHITDEEYKILIMKCDNNEDMKVSVLKVIGQLYELRRSYAALNSIPEVNVCTRCIELVKGVLK